MKKNLFDLHYVRNLFLWRLVSVATQFPVLLKSNHQENHENLETVSLRRISDLVKKKHLT